MFTNRVSVPYDESDDDNEAYAAIVRGIAASVAKEICAMSVAQQATLIDDDVTTIIARHITNQYPYANVYGDLVEQVFIEIIGYEYWVEYADYVVSQFDNGLLDALESMDKAGRIGYLLEYSAREWVESTKFFDRFKFLVVKEFIRELEE